MNRGVADPERAAPDATNTTPENQAATSRRHAALCRVCLFLTPSRRNPHTGSSPHDFARSGGTRLFVAMLWAFVRKGLSRDATGA